MPMPSARPAPSLTAQIVGNDERGALCAVFFASNGQADRDNQIAFMSALEGKLEVKGYKPVVRQIAKDDPGVYYNDLIGRPIFEIVGDGAEVELLLIHPDGQLSDNNFLIDVMDAKSKARTPGF